MEDNKELVENTTENVDELATEELVDGNADANESNDSEKPVKTYTDEEVDEIVKKKLYRKENKIREEYEKKYGKVEELLKAGLEKDNFEDAVNTLEEFYESKGVRIDNSKHLSNRQIEMLSKAEAEDIISGGYEDIVEETDRLANIIQDGTASEEEKQVFYRLAEERKRQEGIKELASIGVGAEALDDKDFREFEKNLNPKMSMKDKYSMYLKFQPKEKVETIGSMKNNTSKNNNQVKEFYTHDEAIKFSKEELDRNPELFKAITNSMTKW